MAVRAATIAPERIAPGKPSSVTITARLCVVLMAGSEKHFAEKLN
jgi:hypothetical protein